MHGRFLQEGFDKQLAHLVEEAGEVISAAGKTQRFGPHSVDPTIPEYQRVTNLHWLMNELDDLEKAIIRLRQTIDKDF